MKRLFPSLPEDASLGTVMRAFPDTLGPWCDYESRVMRGPSPLSAAERELIAAYVSGLNACAYCHNAHTVFARAYGIDPDVIDALMADIETAPIEPKIKPVLAFAGKLTQTPARMTEADAQAVYDQGWSERALFDAIQVCGVFNLVNRMVEGTGVTFRGGDPRDADEDGFDVLRSETFYTDFGRSNGLDV